MYTCFCWDCDQEPIPICHFQLPPCFIQKRLASITAILCCLCVVFVGVCLFMRLCAIDSRLSEPTIEVGCVTASCIRVAQFSFNFRAFNAYEVLYLHRITALQRTNNGSIKCTYYVIHTRLIMLHETVMMFSLWRWELSFIFTPCQQTELNY